MQRKMNLKTLAALLGLSLCAAAAQAGTFEALDCGEFKTHVYSSGDVMGNTSLIVEGKEGLVLMELPLFKENMAEFSDYAAKLGKPAVRVITDYHEGAVAGVPGLMPQGMPAFVKGETYSGMMAHFREKFGDKLVDLPEAQVEEAPFGGAVELAGVPFRFEKGPASDFPAANILIGGKVFYSHWAPAKAHMNPLQLDSVAAIDAELESARAALAAQEAGAKYFVGGHGGLAGEGAVAFRAAYLETVKKLRGEHKTAEAFAEALKKAYPDLPGAEGVEKMAGALYK